MKEAVLRLIAMASDRVFGAQLSSQFDLTLLFEHAILTVLPATLLIVASPFYLFHYLKSPAYVSGGGRLSWAKLAATGALLGVEVASLTLWATLPAYRSVASLAASLLGCIAAICIIAIVNFEHRRSLQSSALLSLYLGLTILLDIVKVRSYLLRSGLQVVGGITVAIATIKFVVLVLEEIPKRKYIKDTALRTSMSKEGASGFWNRSLFLWLNSTLLLGFRRVLQVDHLGHLGVDFASENLSAKFEPNWRKYRNSSHPLITASFHTLFWSFLSVVIPRLLHTAFLFSQPFLLQGVVNFLGEEHPSPSVRNGLIGATILVYAGLAMTKAGYNHMNYRLITRLRGVLVAEILQKNLAISQLHAQESAAITLMSTDVEGLATGLPRFHEIWASLIEFCLGVYFLSTKVGAASFLVVFPGLIATVSGLIIGKQMSPARAKWNKLVEKRVSVTSRVLEQIKSIRISGLGPVIVDMLQELRESEMAHSRAFRVLYVILKSADIFCHALTPILIVTAALFWTKFTNGLEPDQMYTTLAFIALTLSPMHRLMVSYTLFASILGCFQRIEAYLLLDERRDERETISDLVLRNSNKGRETEKTRHSSDLSVMPLDKPSIELQLPQPPVVFVDVSVAVRSESDPVLKNVNFSISRSEIALVLGHTGSGKTTLLRAILGEVHVTHGLVYVEQRQIAYCDQSPWLRNITIRDNIVGDCQYDQDWYETVLSACLLSKDMEQLPNGDQTSAGNNGTNLSGGQRQRIALARAIYSRATLLVLDNVFSALDQSTADAIFHRLLAPEGLLKRYGSTVIMTTHTADYAKAADRIILVDDGGSVSCLTNGAGALQTQNRLRELIADKTQYAANDIDIPVEMMTAQAESDPMLDDRPHFRKQGDAGLYTYYLASTSKLNWTFWLVTLLLAAVTERLPDIYVRIWLDVARGNKLYLLGYVLIGVSNCLFSGLTLYAYYFRVVPDSSETLHHRLLDTVMRSSMSWLSSTSSASLLNLFSQDMSLVSQDLPLALYVFVYLGGLVLTDVGVISSGASYAAAFIPFAFGFFYLIQYFYLRTSRQMRHLDLDAKTPLYAHFTEISTGLLHIRSFGWHLQYLSQGLHFLDYSQKPFYYMFCIQRWLNLVLELSVLGVATFLVSIALCFRDTTTQNSLGLALLVLINFGQQLSDLIDVWIGVETSLGAIARIRHRTEQTPVEQDSDDFSVPPGCLKHGAIQLLDVTATYSTPDSLPKVALKNINLDIKAGQKMAVIGRTGSGKSSLILTLLNFLDYSGTIMIDGVNLSQIPRQHLRSLITVISQDFVELPGTMRHNLLPSARNKVIDQLHEVVIIEVLERVGMLGHIEARGGLDAPLADMGFSHGQKQLLAIARAALHKLEYDSNILFIDEATSSIDFETAEAMHMVLEDFFSGCTVISVSHRPEMLTRSDVVVEIDDGRVLSVSGAGDSYRHV